jgi:uncharacterized Zn-binding protein involved in type VI secretion
MVTGIVPHVGGPILPPGAVTVLIGGLPAARVGDMATCVGPPDVIVKGSATVIIAGMPAARMGDSTAHGGVIVSGCPTVLIGDAAGGGASATMVFGPGAMSMEAATSIFNNMAAQDDIAFKFPVDGCYARAHLMDQRMQKLGANPGKVWTFASNASDPLWVNTPNHPDGKVEWGYHVAPTIPVQQADGTVKDMVIDPSMFDRPVTVDEWRDAQHDHPTVVQTQLGQPPIPSKGGSGYWPAPDPIEGIDEHARETMEDYKLLEGTRGH